MESLENLSLFLGLSSLLGGGIGGAALGYCLGRWVAARRVSQAALEQESLSLSRLLESVDLSGSDSWKQGPDSVRHDSAVELPEGSANQKALPQRPTPPLISGLTRLVEKHRELEQELAEARDRLAQQSQELQRTRREARTDPLCQIGNRKAAEERLGDLLADYFGSGVTFGLMLIDVDQLKQLNDHFGHRAGDRILSEISRLLIQSIQSIPSIRSIRSEDSVFRLCGDEFLVLLSPMNRENLEAVGNRIQQTVASCNFFAESPDCRGNVTLSIGTTLVAEGDTAGRLFERADQALYRAKNLGGNRLTIAD